MFAREQGLVARFVRAVLFVAVCLADQACGALAAHEPALAAGVAGFAGYEEAGAVEPVVVAFGGVVALQGHAEGGGEWGGVFARVVSFVFELGCWFCEGDAGVQCICAFGFGDVACVSHFFSLGDEVAVVCVCFAGAAIARGTAALGQAKYAWCCWGGFLRNVGCAWCARAAWVFIWCGWC